MVAIQSVNAINTKALRPRYSKGLHIERVKSTLRGFANEQMCPNLQLLVIFSRRSNKRNKNLMAVSIDKDSVCDYVSEIDINLVTQKNYSQSNIFLNNRQIETEIIPRDMFLNRGALHTMYASNDLPDSINIVGQRSSVVFYLVKPYIPEPLNHDVKNYTDY